MIDKNQDYHGHKYYFNKEEYENSRFSELKTYKGGAFKRNKTLIITLLDIAVIVLILVVVIPFVRKSYEIPNLNGYSLNLTQYRSNGDIYLNLSIRNKAEGEKIGADLVDIEFFLENSTESIFINDLLPLSGKTLIYRTSILDDGSEKASTKVTIKGKTSVLNVKIQN